MAEFGGDEIVTDYSALIGMVVADGSLDPSDVTSRTVATKELI
jgi:hypothetical protein